MVTGEFTTAIRAIVKDDQGAIPVSNFELHFIKILKEQVLKRVFTLAYTDRPSIIAKLKIPKNWQPIPLHPGVSTLNTSHNAIGFIPESVDTVSSDTGLRLPFDPNPSPFLDALKKDNPSHSPFLTNPVSSLMSPVASLTEGHRPASSRSNTGQTSEMSGNLIHKPSGGDIQRKTTSDFIRAKFPTYKPVNTTQPRSSNNTVLDKQNTAQDISQKNMDTLGPRDTDTTQSWPRQSVGLPANRPTWDKLSHDDRSTIDTFFTQPTQSTFANLQRIAQTALRVSSTSAASKESHLH